MTDDEYLSLKLDLDGELVSGASAATSVLGKTLAVLDLKNEGGVQAASGRLASDFIYRHSYQHRQGNFTLIDRSVIYRQIKERLDKTTSEIADLSLDEQFAQIGRLKLADYIIGGAVTSYTTENRIVKVGYVPDQEDTRRFVQDVENWIGDQRRYEAAFNGHYTQSYNRYAQEYQQYRGEYESYVKGLKNKAAVGTVITLPVTIGTALLGDPQYFHAEPYRLEKLSPKATLFRPNMPLNYTEPETVLELIRAQNGVPEPKPRMITVANVSITLRLVDAVDSKILWFGSASTRTTDLHKGMREISEGLVNDMINDLQGTDLPSEAGDRGGFVPFANH